MGRPLPLKSLAFASGMAVLTALLASLAMVPALAFFLFLVLLPAPLLMAWVYMAEGGNWAFGSAALAVVLAFLLGGTVVASIALVCSLGGLALGAAVTSRAPPLLAGVMLTVAMLSGVLLVLAAFKLAAGGDVFAPLRQAAGDLGQGWATQLFLPADRAKALQQQMADQIIYLFPANLLLFFSGCSLLIYVLARWTLGRRYEVPAIRPFAEWHLPRWVTWLFVPGFLFWLLGLRPSMRGATRVGDNLLQVMSTLFEAQGLAVVVWWLRKRLNRIVSGVVATLVIFVPLGSMVLLFLGLWDVLFDFRKLEPRPER